MPLVKINTDHDIASNQTLQNLANIDNYYLEIDRGTGDRVSGKNQLSFTSEGSVGGSHVGPITSVRCSKCNIHSW